MNTTGKFCYLRELLELDFVSLTHTLLPAASMDAGWLTTRTRKISHHSSTTEYNLPISSHYHHIQQTSSISCTQRQHSNFICNNSLAKLQCPLPLPIVRWNGFEKNWMFFEDAVINVILGILVYVFCLILCLVLLVFLNDVCWFCLLWRWNWCMLFNYCVLWLYLSNRLPWKVLSCREIYRIVFRVFLLSPVSFEKLRCGSFLVTWLLTMSR